MIKEPIADGEWPMVEDELGDDMKHSFSQAIACRFFSDHQSSAISHLLSALIFL